MFFRRPSCLERRPHFTRKRACSMKLSFQTAGPDGARTLLVKTSVSPDAYQDLTQRLLSVQELQAQQVAFLTPPQGDGVVRLETAAGALSGDLLRQAGLSFAVSRGIRREKKFPVEAQSVPAPLLVHANPLTGQVTVDLPPPQAQGTRSLFGQQASVLHFPGLSYVICQGSALPPDPELRTLLSQLAREWEIPGAGVLFWNPQEDFMRSAVYLPKTDTLLQPPCCSTAAAAMAAWHARRQEGLHKRTIRQPGGPLQTTVAIQGGSLRRLSVGGPVTLGPAYEIAF